MQDNNSNKNKNKDHKNHAEKEGQIKEKLMINILSCIRLKMTKQKPTFHKGLPQCMSE